MRATATGTPRSFILSSCFVFLCTPLLTFAADQAPAIPATSPAQSAGEAATPTGKAVKSKPKSPKAAKSTSKRAKAKPPAAATVTEDAALASFDTFTIEWMDKLSRTEEFQRTQRVKIAESPEGFSAEYIGYLPHRYIVVKKTSSKATPFVGILTYFEKTLRCRGKTKEEALQGPFEQVETNLVSEIFRFTKGKWEY
jgi:hypothetical protein